MAPEKELFLLDDINIDYSNRLSGMFRNYSRLLSMFNCSQIITEATRITAETSTLLDHIITNSLRKVKCSGVMDCGFSDHLAIFCTKMSQMSKMSLIGLFFCIVLIAQECKNTLLQTVLQMSCTVKYKVPYTFTSYDDR